MTSIARSVAALTVILLLIVGSAGSADSEPSGVEEFPVSLLPAAQIVATPGFRIAFASVRRPTRE